MHPHMLNTHKIKDVPPKTFMSFSRKSINFNCASISNCSMATASIEETAAVGSVAVGMYKCVELDYLGSLIKYYEVIWYT